MLLVMVTTEYVTIFKLTLMTPTLKGKQVLNLVQAVKDAEDSCSSFSSK